MSKKLNVGDNVTFDNDKIELFKAETSSEKAVQQHQKLVLGGVNQVGIVKEDLGGNLTTRVLS